MNSYHIHCAALPCICSPNSAGVAGYDGLWRILRYGVHNQEDRSASQAHYGAGGRGPLQHVQIKVFLCFDVFDW